MGAAMTLSALLHAIFGGAHAADHSDDHKEWRDAVHDRREQVERAKRIAELSIRSSDAALSTVTETIRMQEQQAVDRQFLNRARGRQ